MPAFDYQIAGPATESPQNQAAEFIATLIDGSFRGTGPDAGPPTGRARNFLSKILERFDAEGVVFWRFEGPEYTAPPGKYHRLVSGVSVFKERDKMPERLEMRDLPIDGTNSGLAFTGKKKVFGRVKGADVTEHDLPCLFYGNHCFTERNITWLLALPVISPETDVFGVLSLYWRDDQKQQALDSDHSFFEIAAALWPGVYQRIRESRRLQLITAVDSILGQSRGSSSLSPDSAPLLAPIPPAYADEIMGDICQKIGVLLHAEEVSIFLTPLNSAEQVWACRASNWLDKPTRTYNPAFLPGITGWCLKQRAPIYIPDLHSFDKDKEWLNSFFGGNLSAQTWEDDLALSDIDSSSERPVRSFLAAPLVVEGVLVGVIRCTSRANSPLIYFSNPDRTSLEMVGTRIAQTWRNWQIAHSKNEEANAWHRFNNCSREIGQILSETISRQSPDFDLLKASVLKACRAGLGKWGVCDIGQQEFGMRDGEVMEDKFHFKEAHSGAKDSSPVRGILEMAERQLAVYRTVFRLVAEVRTGTGVLNRALSDLRHQIINPLNKALLRANRHLKSFGHLSHVGDAVFPIRGLLRKSVNVANAFHMLVELEKTGQLKITSAALDPRRLYMLLTEVVRDARLDLDFDRTRNLSLVLQENLKNPEASDSGPKFEFRSRRMDLKIDLKLIEQVLNSVIENAAKYSNAGNSIIVDVNLNDAEISINVKNRGARLLPEETSLVVERNWRSPTAMRYVGEGTGIGLYLVNAIAIAHGGAFKMSPTNEEGYTWATFRIPSNNKTYETHSS